jgi:gamma-glutamyltranspeptidase/glutathione hydrolase
MLTRTYHFNEVVTDEGLVCAPDPHVAAAGASVLQAGGNAVDAAVAAAFAEGVVEPWSSGVGGSATMTIALRSPDRVIVVEGHMTVPAGVSADQYPLAPKRTEPGRLGVFDWPQVVDNVNLYGAKSVAVPGAVAALCEAHQRYGRLPLSRVLEPAISLAADGFGVNWFTAGFLASDAKSLLRDPGCTEIFLPGGLPLSPPSARHAGRLVQRQLATTLERIGAEGPSGFYRGPLAEAMVRFIQSSGGKLSLDDLASYDAFVTESPLQKRYGPFTVVGSPTMGSPTLVQALYLYDEIVRSEQADPPAEAMGRHDDAVAWAKALDLAFRDRLLYMTADPEIAVPWEGLRSREYARDVWAAERDGKPAPDPALYSGESADAPGEASRPAAGGFTSQSSVGDRDGNLVSMTTTQLNSWGARLLDPETGVLFNNGIGYFDPRPGARNGIRPGLGVLSAMSPTILCDETGPVAALGASGGPRIISGVAQIIAGLATRRVSLQEAIEGPRIHVDGKNVLLDSRWPSGTAEAIQDAGYTVEVLEELPTTGNFARPNGVLIDRDGKRHSGVDPIRPGDAATG